MGSTEESQNGAGNKNDLSHIGYTPIIKTSEPWTVPKVLEQVEHMPSETKSSPIAFFHMLERLKTTKREGWRRFGLER